MIELTPPFRRATPDDALALTELVDFASEGFAPYLWAQIAGPGGDPWAIGRERALREVGGFSYRNAVVLEKAGRVAAGLIGYPLPDRPEPIDNLPPLFAPLQELENLAPGTWYVNVLAAYPGQRSQGLGTTLLALADKLAANADRSRGLSLIVSDTNTGARRLYERCGYGEVARRRKVKNGWQNAGNEWVLLVKHP